ncbi:cysteine ABC transporter substrate-binding protein, partial [Enterobacter hormaechei subsp. steigerwaltii]|nr:cysteine ABC transporter substrate-binding protein [Enterobacter hormaechei subsp. steigerwaltii]
MAAKMKGFKKRAQVLGLVAAWGLVSAQAQADRLADIKAAGVVKVATFDA